MASPPPCPPACPVATAARIVEGKWTTLIVRELLGGCKRFSELQRALPGISAKVLTERLKLLEEHHLLSKRTYACIPPKTEYSLTALGMDLQQVIQAMASFGTAMQQAAAGQHDQA